MTLFANCSGFNERQIITLAELRGGTSAVLVLATFVLMVVTCAGRSRLDKRDKRLKVYLFTLFGVSISYLTVLSLGVVYHILPDSIAVKWCVAFGFFDQILSVVQTTLLFIVIMEVFWTHGYEENISGKKNCVLRGLIGTIIVVATLIGISSIAPFFTHTYGEVGGWCWIHNFNQDCEEHFGGLIEQIFLWIVYHALISLTCILMVLRAVILFLWACIYSYRLRNYESLDGRYDLKHLFFKYIFQLIILAPIFVDITYFILVVHTHHYSFPKWVAFATAHPIGAFLIPLSFLLYIKSGHAGSRNNQAHAQVNDAANGQGNCNPQVNPSENERNIHPTADPRVGTQDVYTHFDEVMQTTISIRCTTTDVFVTADENLTLNCATGSGETNSAKKW